MRSDLDDLIFIVRELWRGCVGIISDVVGYKMGGDKERKGASIREEADLVDRSDDAVDSLAFERSPNNSSISNCKLGQTTSW